MLQEFDAKPRSAYGNQLLRQESDLSANEELIEAAPVRLEKVKGRRLTGVLDS